MEFLGVYRGCTDQEADGDLDYLVDDEDYPKKYQNENVYNRLLPYDITNECQSHLMRIKASLAKCVQLDQETVYEWFIELERFVDLYGLSFTKEDHIYFVKLQYEIMICKDNMDLYYITDVARCFSRLMRKRYLIGVDELQLDWRPLYEAYERLLFSETETLGLRFVPENLEPNLSQAIRLARPQFSVEATKEMLDEWRPMLYPFGQYSIQRTVTYLNLFLPTTLPPEQHDKGFKLWFDELMQFWLNCKVGVSNESKLTLLLSRLSSDCLGFVDWEPYIPMIFNQFKANLNLNGAMNRNHAHRRSSDSADVGPYVQWMVYMINRDGSCLDYIEKLFKAIESFYHPSNTDRRWHSKLQQFLYKLPSCYAKRLYRERFKKNIWSRRLPESHRLTDEQTSRIVDALLPVVVTSMFNQSGVSTAALAFRELAVLKPEKVIPPLLERLYGSYETLTEPHRLLASINCMASVVPAMVRPSKNFQGGQNHVVPLLLNSLPGIDSNDMRKCITVFRFIATLAAHVRMKDYSYLVNERQDLTAEEQQLCLSTSQFEDFVIQFLDKCFVLIENSTSAHTFSNPDLDNQVFRSGEEGIIEAAISSVTLSILAQASKEIQLAALDKLYSHVTRHLFDTKTQGQAISTLCLACAKVLPRETLAKFVPHFGRLVLTLTENDDVFQETNLDHELTFSLLLLSEIVRCNSSYILEHRQLIVEVLQRTFKLKSKEGYLLGCAILRHLLRALTNITCCDWRNVDPEDEAIKKIEETWPFDNWGFATNIKNLKLKWEIPGPESRQFALELLEIFSREAIEGLLAWIAGKQSATREEVQRSLHVVLSSLIGAASVLPSIDSPIIDLNPNEVPVVPMCISYTGTEPLYYRDNENIRNYITEAMKKVLDYIVRNYQDDTKSLGIICEIFTTSISYYGYNKSELRLAAERIKSLKLSTQNKLLGGKRHLRYLLVERVAQQQRAMLLNKGDPNFTQLHLDIFECFLNLSQSHYVNVRILAQDGVYLMLNYFPFLETKLVPRLVEEFAKPEIEHKKFKGLLYLVAGRRSFSPIVLDPNWTTLRQLWPAFISSPHSEKPSIVRLIDRICNSVGKGFDTFQLRFNFSKRIKSIASEVWSFEGDSRVDQSLYPAPDDKLIEEVNQKVKLRNDKRVQNYEELVEKMTELVDNPLLHWHRRVAAYTLFAQLLREDYPLPLNCLELCLNYLINDRLSFRTKAVQLVSAQLKLHKRKHAKRVIKTTRSKVRTPELMSKANQKIIGHKPMSCSLTELEENIERLSLHSFGVQEEENLDYKPQLTDEFDTLGLTNRWMQYRLTDVDYTKEEWEKLIFIDKPYIGYYDWPQKLEIYEPYERQPKLDRAMHEMTAHESLVYQKFTDPKFVQKLIEYFCFEDTKGSPENRRFDSKRPTLFKGLFRNYGPCLIEPFRKYVLDFAKDDCEQKQKFVLEFFAGLMRGSKHWSYEMLMDLKNFVLPILDQMTITQKNYNDWIGMTNFVFKDRDMNRLRWLLNYLITKATAPKELSALTMTPFIQASRLTIAHYALIQCEWRAVSYVFPRVVENLRDQDHLLAYANIRTCLASIYSLIFMYDDPNALSLIPGTLENVPRRIEFTNRIKSKLTILEKDKLSLLEEEKLAQQANLNKEKVVDSSSDPHGSDQLADFNPRGSFVCAASVGSPESSGVVLPTSITSSSPDDMPPVSEDTDLELIADSLMKFSASSNSDTTLDSPARPSPTHVERASHVYHPHRDGTKVEEKASGQAVVGPEVTRATSFVDNLRNSIPNLNVPTAHSSSSSVDPSGDTPERRNAIKLMKLYCCWIIHNVFRMKSPVPADFFRLFPLICEMGRESYDPELTTESLTAVAVLGGWTLSPEAVVASLKCIRKIVSDHSWHARVAAAAFMEIAVSSNLIQLICYEEWRSEIEDIIINHLICDERIEVRESSSLTLSGMIHCQFIKLSPELIEKFKERANHQLVKRKQISGTTVIDPKSTVIRHSGVLCLCACVDAHPYTVPDYLPSILTFLSDHLTDPQPICVSTNPQFCLDSWDVFAS